MAQNPDGIAGIPDSIPIDDALTAIARRERRQLLLVLSKLRRPEPLSAITRTLVVTSDRHENAEVQQVLTRLYHVHVPKLVEASVVSYDDATGTVELTDRGETLAAAVGGKDDA